MPVDLIVSYLPPQPEVIEIPCRMSGRNCNIFDSGY